MDNLRKSKWAYINGTTYREGYAIKEKNGLFGFVDLQGQETIPCIYEKVTYFGRGYASVYKEGKCGLIDTSGKVIVPFSDYDYIAAITDDLFQVTKQKLKGFYSRKKDVLFPCIYDKTDWRFEENLILVKEYKTGLSGLINLNGEIALPCIYKIIKKFDNGNFFLVKYNRNWGLIGRDFKEFLRCSYDEIKLYDNNLICVKIKGMTGFVDLSEEIMPRNSIMFCDMISRVYHDDICCFMDNEGNVYSRNMSLCTGYSVGEREEWFFGSTIVVRKHLTYGVLDNTGKILIQFNKYGYVDLFFKGLARIRAHSDLSPLTNNENHHIRPMENIEDCKWGVINSLGEEVLPAIYDEVWNFCGSNLKTIRVKKDGNYKDIFFRELLSSKQ